MQKVCFLIRLFENGTLEVDPGYADPELFTPDNFCVAFDNVSDDGSRFEKPKFILCPNAIEEGFSKVIISSLSRLFEKQQSTKIDYWKKSVS
jgi:hypothetical protein